MQHETQLRLPFYTRVEDFVADGITDTSTALRWAQECDWIYKGGGAACTVYIPPAKDRVVKFLNVYDGGQLATARAAQAHPDNPHLPKVLSVTELDGGPPIIECELLEAYPKEFNDWRKTYAPPRRARACESDLTALPDGPMKDALLALKDAAQEVESENEGFIIWDAHDGNVMVRPGTKELVLNDLLYDKGDSFMSTDGYCGSDCSCCSKCGSDE